MHISPSDLSPQRRKIVELYAWGLAAKEIASELGIATNTVNATLQVVKEQVGLNKATELAAWYFCRQFNISLEKCPIKRMLSILSMLFVILAAEAVGMQSELRVKSTRVRAKTSISRVRRRSEDNYTLILS